MDVRARQAESADVLAAFLREYPVPLVSWHINSLDGSLQGQIYRDDTDATFAELTTIAELLGTQVTEESPEGSASWAQQAVYGHYQQTPIAVYGHIAVAPSE